MVSKNVNTYTFTQTEWLCPLCTPLHRKNRTTCSGLLKTILNNVRLPTLFNAVNNIVQYC